MDRMQQGSTFPGGAPTPRHVPAFEDGGFPTLRGPRTIKLHGSNGQTSRLPHLDMLRHLLIQG
jgi:hypothetical protein